MILSKVSLSVPSICFLEYGQEESCVLGSYHHFFFKYFVEIALATKILPGIVIVFLDSIGMNGLG